ncbi:CRIB domain-containing protein RIC1-like [Glycine soja]|uniref:CRIB domain-containing protein RIC1 isoform A n=1 Tax=Glycine soja TaxID=3848 RepID=A0A445IFZ9_GLYSO|nr:CRIB domain-containing protein RIC1-like [Glycine soja]RZB85027.1 CRIB domain-containing protein RIC1 isoform A [Glycine soja]RZB85028.1 CRIB domain-containing protein RIC1 isoform B [Glycine soja]
MHHHQHLLISGRLINFWCKYINELYLHKLMPTKVKGLLKYISQIFEEKEEEFQIGLPTDVRHVAHIGSDDPSANAPSWMNDIKRGKEPPSGNPTQTVEECEKKSSSNSKRSKIRNHLIPKSRHTSIDIDPDAPKQKPIRRHNRSSDPSADSSNHESSSGGYRRRGSNHGVESSSSQDMPPTGVKTNRRKSKASENSSVKKPSSRRSSKVDSLTDISISDFGSGSGPESGLTAIRI